MKKNLSAAMTRSPLGSGLSLMAAILTALLLTLTGVSCSSKKDVYAQRKPVHPVKGKVLYQNKPAAGAQVLFIPEKESPEGDPRPRAEADKEGMFTLTTYDSDDGAPAGSYIVTVIWPGGVLPDGREEPEDKLFGRYATQKSPLRAVVKEGANELEPFQLK
jgi:hypothetical protein